MNNHLGVLGKMLNIAVEWELLDSAPKIKRLKAEEAETDFLTFEEADRLVEAAEPEWRPMILTALRTGLRRGELMALRWQDVDLKGRRLVVRRNRVHGKTEPPKNFRSREVPLAPSVVAALKAHKRRRGPLVFCQENGSYLNVNPVHEALSRACKRAVLRHIGWHVCRHTFASHLVMKGVPLRTVQELLGHRSIKMTERYSHLSPEAKVDAVQLLDERSEGQKPEPADQDNVVPIDGAVR